MTTTIYICAIYIYTYIYAMHLEIKIANNKNRKIMLKVHSAKLIISTLNIN